ncbi:hypothetical protein DTO166G4_8003 [Paecilomyces variotii]|nr:hypothetical protein DTO166G4_8003 [Paecilomyces variotii]KAJ9228383.1 hypothetical protein DTO166G5_8599 [Paecilomyces variotii]KAJ9248138.1 hypothetical protein DTO207G8_7579 [Paecilomyces variotii]KAJ9284336.1 hypothetical protein DTO021C3_8124 [Paecilomyces variotii]KAJ9306270.1 hypothetical protein DTO217A2_4204 [Paecilomyces variotii]
MATASEALGQFGKRQYVDLGSFPLQLLSGLYREAAGHSFTAPSPSFDKLTRNIFSSPFLELLVLPVTVLGLSDT